MPKVEVSVFCERAQKEVRVALPLEEANAFFAQQEVKARSAETFRQALAVESAEETFPDLIVYYKGKYVVHATVLPRNEGTLLALLKALTRAAVFGYQKKVRRKKISSNNGTRQYAPPVPRASEVTDEEVRGI